MNLLSYPTAPIFGLGKERLFIGPGEKGKWEQAGNIRWKTWEDPNRFINISRSEQQFNNSAILERKQLIVRSTDEKFGGIIMWIEEDITRDKNKVYTVTVEASLQHEKYKREMTAVSYSELNEGKSSLRHMYIGNQEPQEYDAMNDTLYEAFSLSRMRKNGIRSIDELPEYINVEETVITFLEQISRNDFSLPSLIPLYPSENKKLEIEEKIRWR